MPLSAGLSPIALQPPLSPSYPPLSLPPYPLCPFTFLNTSRLERLLIASRRTYFAPGLFTSRVSAKRELLGKASVFWHGGACSLIDTNVLLYCCRVSTMRRNLHDSILILDEILYVGRFAMHDGGKNETRKKNVIVIYILSIVNIFKMQQR